MNTTPTASAEANSALTLLLWALLTADVCAHEDDGILLTWDREAGGTVQVRVPMSGHLPDFGRPTLAPALKAISDLRDLDAPDDLDPGQLCAAAG